MKEAIEIGNVTREGWKLSFADWPGHLKSIGIGTQIVYWQSVCPRVAEWGRVVLCIDLAYSVDYYFLACYFSIGWRNYKNLYRYRLKRLLKWSYIRKPLEVLSQKHKVDNYACAPSKSILVVVLAALQSSLSQIAMYHAGVLSLVF